MTEVECVVFYRSYFTDENDVRFRVDDLTFAADVPVTFGGWAGIEHVVGRAELRTDSDGNVVARIRVSNLADFMETWPCATGRSERFNPHTKTVPDLNISGIRLSHTPCRDPRIQKIGDAMGFKQ